MKMMMQKMKEMKMNLQAFILICMQISNRFFQSNSVNSFQLIFIRTIISFPQRVLSPPRRHRGIQWAKKDARTACTKDGSREMTSRKALIRRIDPSFGFHGKLVVPRGKFCFFLTRNPPEVKIDPGEWEEAEYWAPVWFLPGGLINVTPTNQRPRFGVNVSGGTSQRP